MDEKRSWLTNAVNTFNAHYPTFLEGIIGLGDIVQTLTQTVIVSFGTLTVLCFFLIVEQQRVLHGIALFEIDTGLASFAAWAVVLGNLVIEFQIVHIDSKANYKPKEMRGSARLAWINIAYWLGTSPEKNGKWKAQSLPPSHGFRRFSRLVTWTILALALAGSMRDMILQQNEVWYQALINVVANSTLSDMTVWIGGFLFAATAVYGAQRLSHYTALRVIEIKRQMQYRKQQAQRTQRAITRLSHQNEGAAPRPAWGEHRRMDLQPVKVKLAGGKTAYQCPNCGKQMSRQGWQNHPCRLTVVAPVVDGQVDTVDAVDKVDGAVDGQPVRQSVNGRDNRVNE